MPADSIFIKKLVRDLTSGDIILHPIYRSDGLMLIKQYKTLENDLALKIRQLIPEVLTVLVLSRESDLETFNRTHTYSNADFIAELEKICEEHSEYMHTPLEISALLDIRAVNEYNLGAADTGDFRDMSFIAFLGKSPFFSTFEERLESPVLRLRAKKAKVMLIDTIKENKVLSDKLNMLKEYKDIILLHSINTTCVALMIGLVLELTETDLMDLAIANLLIDISITQIPKEQFDLHLRSEKPKRAFYHLHLNQLKELSHSLPLIRKESIIYGLLDQYEYYGGNGYPMGKKGSDISLFGRIISIAQTYDEMVGGYFYNNGIKPVQAMQKIWENRSNKIDPNIIRVFIDRTTVMKIGQHIIYDDIYQGDVIGFTDFADFPLSPIIKTKNGDIIDLLLLQKR